MLDHGDDQLEQLVMKFAQIRHRSEWSWLILDGKISFSPMVSATVTVKTHNDLQPLLVGMQSSVHIQDLVGEVNIQQTFLNLTEDTLGRR